VRRFNNIADVVNWRLCMGCGACVPACPERVIHLVDVQGQGIRPIIDSAKCKKCGECVKACPGIDVSHQRFNSETIPQLRQAWGPVLEVWEGYATDSEIRYMGSSGGVATALALFCLEREQASGVLHIGAVPELPWQNAPVLSRSKKELLAFTGSRYSPAAPCERLDWIEQAESSCVFIGKPCDVVALRKSQAINRTIEAKVALAISIFCAGTPSTQGTFNLFHAVGTKPEQVKELRYRGCGWPGTTIIELKGTNGKHHEVAYEQSWGSILSKHVQLRCRLCPDGTGEFADIACGDPWYRKPDLSNPGQSLVLARTEKGRLLLKRAAEAGYVTLKRIGTETVALSQKALLRKRRNLWGRLLAMRIMLIPVPRFDGFSLFANWRCLYMYDKVRSVLGTIKRIIIRKLYRPINYLPRIDKFGKDGIFPAAR